MRTLALITVALLTCTCRATEQPSSPQPSAVPSKSDIDRLEVQLASDPCIGSLQKWERTYRIHRNIGVGDPNRGKIYPDRIDFLFREAGRFGIQSGRNVRPPRALNVFVFDDTPVRMAWGSFRISAGKLNLDFCGPNYGSQPNPAARS